MYLYAVKGFSIKCDRIAVKIITIYYRIKYSLPIYGFYSFTFSDQNYGNPTIKQLKWSKYV